MTSDRISSFTASLVGRTIAYAVDDVEGDRFRARLPKGSGALSAADLERVRRPRAACGAHAGVGVKQDRLARGARIRRTTSSAHPDFAASAASIAARTVR